MPLTELAFQLRLSLKALRRNPVFSAAVVLILALVLGAGTACFSSIYGLIFPRLPFPAAQRIVAVESLNSQTGTDRMTAGEFRAVQHGVDEFRDIAAYVAPLPTDSIFSDRLWGTQETISIAGSTAGLFHLLGTAPAMGRPIRSMDETEAAPLVAVLSNHFWREHFASSPGVLGQSITVNHFGRMIRYRVIAVMPPGVQFPYPFEPTRPDLWANEYAGGSMPFSLLGGYLGVIGRLRPGASLASARGAVAGVAARLGKRYPRVYAGRTMRVVLLRSELARGQGAIFVAFAGAMGLIVLIGCADIAAVLLIRALRRRREMSVRAALGASRATLIGQQLAELAPLFAGGAAFGILLSLWLAKTFFVLAPAALAVGRLASAALATGTFVVTGLVLGAVAMAAAVLPALVRAGPNAEALAGAGGQLSLRGKTTLHSGRLLVVLQVSLCLTLVTASVALGLDLHRMLSSDAGFRPSRLAELKVGLSNVAPNAPGYVSQRFQEFTRQVKAIPGVQSATLCDGFPTPQLVYTAFRSPGSVGNIGMHYQGAEVHTVAPNFFEFMGFRIIRGRGFEARDTIAAPAVAIVNAAMARRFWRGRSLIGSVLQSNLGQGITGNRAFRIIGVVRESRRFGSGRQAAPAVYLSVRQEPARRLAIVVRSRGDPGGLSGPLRRAALAIAPGQTYVGPLRTGAELVAAATARTRFVTVLVAVFAGLALLLLATGTYGVVSYDAAMRTKEMAIRLALGATPAQSGALMLRRSMAPVSAGILLGLLGSYLFAGTASALLYGFQPPSLATYCGSAGIVLALALAACYPPARRVSMTDPAATLQAE